MKNILTYLTLILLVVLQSTVLSRIEILHIIPNVILVFVVCYSMYAEPSKTVIFAVVSGLVVDILQAHHIGLTALIMMFIGLALSVISSDYIRSNIITIIIATVVSTFVFEGLYGFLLYVMFSKMTAEYMFNVIFIETLYNIFASVLLMWWAKFLAEDEIRSF